MNQNQRNWHLTNNKANTTILIQPSPFWPLRIGITNWPKTTSLLPQLWLRVRIWLRNQPAGWERPKPQHKIHCQRLGIEIIQRQKRGGRSKGVHWENIYSGLWLEQHLNIWICEVCYESAYLTSNLKVFSNFIYLWIYYIMTCIVFITILFS